MRENIIAATVIAVMLVCALLALPILTVVDQATAHACQAEDPAKSCGECKYSWYGGTDRHSNNKNETYCEKTSPTPRPICGHLVSIDAIDNTTSYSSFCPP